MNLTDENQDDMDCRPLGQETGFQVTLEGVKNRLAEFRRAKTEKALPTNSIEHPLGDAHQPVEL